MTDMDLQKTKRAEQIQSPSIVLPFRLPDGQIIRQDVWREDVLEWRPDERLGPQWYLVLDFGVEQAAVVRGANPLVGEFGEYVFEDTGRIQLDLQPVVMPDDDPNRWVLDDAEGLGPRVVRFADVPTDEIGDRPNQDGPPVGRPMAGWRRHPLSGRRSNGGG